VEDWGGKDFQDIMAGVDTVVAAGLADPQRLGVTGWSYGGFMTCWTVTQTQRFKAAITGACISNRHSFYGTSDIGFTFGEHHFGGTPWDDPDKLLERSAIHHIRNVTTPVLILHGEADLRCPVEQAEQFFIALKRQHKHAVLVRYPGEYHGFKKPSHQIDRFARVLAWFEYYLKR
jgi:dipeptidyl aminopeptidase/acylaminoacyl peptidase